jgi:hypothetical protein
MIKTVMLNMAVDAHRIEYERLLNEAKYHKTIKFMDNKDSWDKDGRLHIFLVYDEQDMPGINGKQTVKLTEEEFPNITFVGGEHERV